MVIAIIAESRSASVRNRDRHHLGTLIGMARNTQFKGTIDSRERTKGLLSCDDEYEFGVCECFDRNHLLVLDYQSLAGMHLHSADLNFACCRY